MIKECNISIAGLGNVGSQVIKNIEEYRDYIIDKSQISFNIVGISAKNKSKKRIINIDNYKWFDNPENLITIPDMNVFVELIGEEKGLSYQLVKKSLQNKINVITANKALLSNHGNELFHIADTNNVLLLFEAAVAGGLPIVRLLKQSLFLNKINKISGILNGTTNFILSEMEKNNLNFNKVLEEAQKNGFAEANPINDIEGIDAAHKLSLLSGICFGVKINLNNIECKGITDIQIDDIINAKKLGYKIKLIATSEIINNHILSVVEPTLISDTSQLSNVDGVLNGIKIQTDNLNSLFLEGQGAGSKATTSSIISDLFEITNKSKSYSFGHKIEHLKDKQPFSFNDRISSYYLRIQVKDIPGVLAKITSSLNDEGISIETIFQIPVDSNKSSNSEVPIIITTHKTTFNLLTKALNKIENLEFVVSKIAIINIDNNIS